MKLSAGQLRRAVPVVEVEVEVEVILVDNREVLVQ